MQKAGETKAGENARWQGGAERKLRVLLRLLLILPPTRPATTAVAHFVPFCVLAKFSFGRVQLKFLTKQLCTHRSGQLSRTIFFVVRS